MTKLRHLLEVLDPCFFRKIIFPYRFHAVLNSVGLYQFLEICTYVVEICTNLKGSSTALSDSCGQLQAHSRHNVLLHPLGEQRSSLDAKVLLVDQPDPLDHVLLGVRAQGFRLAFTLFFFAAACPSSSSFCVVLMVLASW
jgi:hypothetical protein